jgi:hypothetical protein
MTDRQPTSPAFVLGTGIVLSVVAGALIAYGISTDNSAGVAIGAIVGAVAQVVTMIGAAAVGFRIARLYDTWDVAQRRR